MAERKTVRKHCCEDGRKNGNGGNEPVGSLVLSISGKDKGRVLMVVAHCAEDERFVFVSDGRKRRIEKPKRKNRKHLRLLSEKMPAGTGRRGKETEVPPQTPPGFTNRAIRDAIRRAGTERENGKGKEGKESQQAAEIRMEEGSFCRKTT